MRSESSSSISWRINLVELLDDKAVLVSIIHNIIIRKNIGYTTRLLNKNIIPRYVMVPRFKLLISILIAPPSKDLVDFLPNLQIDILNWDRDEQT